MQLPEATRRATLRRLVEGAADLHAVRRPPPAVRRAVARIVRHLAGRPDDLRSVHLDMGGVTAFERRVYAEARRIGPGRTATYGEIAARVGSPRAARAVGRTLARNPFALVVPCHRIVGAAGALGGFSAHGGVAAKEQLLRIERPPAGTPPSLASPSVRRAAVNHLRRADPVLRGVIERVGPCTITLQRGGYYKSLVEAIVYQQLTGKAAATIFERFRSLFGPRGFPSPAEVSSVPVRRLRAIGLSRLKIAYIRDLSQRAARGALPLDRIARMSDDDAVDALTTVKGIGRWTAQMFLIFRLGRADVLAEDDYGLRKAVRDTYRLRALPSPRTLDRIARAWRPYRSVATWYLWRTAGPVLVGGP